MAGCERRETLGVVNPERMSWPVPRVPGSVQAGFLKQVEAGCRGLCFTGRAGSILKGEEPLRLVHDDKYRYLGFFTDLPAEDMYQLEVNEQYAGGVEMKTLLRVGLLLAIVLLVGLIPISGIGAENRDVKAIFEKRCSLCHPASRPLSTTKSGEEWKKTVNRMKGYAGDRISDKDAETIVEYLTEIRGK